MLEAARARLEMLAQLFAGVGAALTVEQEPDLADDLRAADAAVGLVVGAGVRRSTALAGELAPYGITVNNVLPGFTRTPRIESLFKARAEKEQRSIADIEKEAMALIPLGRFAEPEETAAAIAFLASPAAGYINGINLPVDGGRTQSL